MKDVYNYLAKEVPEYWSESNRRFEETDPTAFQRMWRAFNPLTGFGSALGDFRDSAENRDAWGMGLAATSMIPAVGYMTKTGDLTSSLALTAKKSVPNSAVSSFSDIYHYDGPEEARPRGRLGEVPSTQQLKERAAFIEHYRSVVGNRFNPAATQAVQKQEAQPYPMTPTPKRNTP